MLPLYLAHLTDGSFFEKSDNFRIEDFGGFSRDGGVAWSNPLPRGTFVPGRFVTIPDYINATLTSASSPVAVLRVPESATQLHR